MSTITQIIADAYRKMVNPPAPVPAARPKWVPASITEENVTSFVQAVTEARKANESIVEFNGKKYGIKKEETNKEDDDKAKKIQDMDAEKAPGDKRAEMAEELVGNQHKLDVNKNGKVDGDDLKKLRGEEKEEDSDENDGDEKDADHAEPDADDMGGPSDHDADNEDEDEMNESESPEWITHPNNGTLHLRHAVKSKLHGHVYPKGTDQDDWRADHPTNPKEHPAAVARVKAKGRTYGRPMNGMDTYVPKYNESTQLTGEQTISSVAATYAAMVNEKTELDKKVDGRQKHTVELDHRDLDKVRYFLEKPHHDQANKDMHNVIRKHFGHLHDMNESFHFEGTAAMVNENDEYAGDNPVDKLHLDVPAFIKVLEKAREEFKTDEDIHNFTQQLLAMKSDCIHTEDLPSSPVKEGTAADAEAGPEVMDPVTQKAKDDADDETEIKDGVPGAAQDGGDKVSPADKPAAANKSAALPKISVITAPVTTNESTENMNPETIKSVGEAYIKMHEAQLPINEDIEDFAQKHGSAVDIWGTDKQHAKIHKLVAAGHKFKSVAYGSDRDDGLKSHAVAHNRIASLKAKGWNEFHHEHNYNNHEVLLHKAPEAK